MQHVFIYLSVFNSIKIFGSFIMCTCHFYYFCVCFNFSFYFQLLILVLQWICMYVCKILFVLVKGIVHPKMKILSCTHPQVVPNLYECLCSAECKGRYFEESL